MPPNTLPIVDGPYTTLVMAILRYICIIAGMLIGGYVILRAAQILKGDKSKPGFSLITNPNSLKMITVSAIVLTAAILALVHVVSGEAAVAVFSSIAGYVLGNMKRDSTKPDKKTEIDESAN